MLITSKRGAQDNIVAYEHICDTTEDLQNINPQYITLGSTCIVVQGENGGVDAYIATSDKQWVPLGSGSDDGSSEEDTKKYENSNVRFIDYDGKVVDGYSAEEFLQLNKMPKNPNHKNDKIPLTAQGWNWSFEDAQAYVRKYGKLNVGQMYIPSDGKTHMILDVGPRLTIPLMIQQTVSEGVTINWGDGSAEETIEGIGTVTASHTYEVEGEYDITLDVANGCTLDFGDGANNNVFGETSLHTYIPMLKKLFIGNGVVSIGILSFFLCCDLTTLLLPNSVRNIGQQAFTYCISLISLIIPNSLESVATQAFYNCTAMNNLTISSNILSIGSYAFGSCFALTNLTISNNMTNIETYSFGGCYSLTDIIIPNGVTTIKQQTFMNCYALANLTISNSVESIGQQSFINCYALYVLTVLAETPPTLANVNVFNNMPADCTIYVPYGTGDTYKAASGWSKWASQIQELPE